jgi:hypothetical protein
MHLRLPACCPLEQLTFSNYGAIFLDDDFSWTLIYNQLKQHLQDCNSTVAMENFQSILGTEWLADPVIFTMIDCLKTGMPLPDSETARTMDPPSAAQALCGPLSAPILSAPQQAHGGFRAQCVRPAK